MNFNPVGDIAQNLILRRQGVGLRKELSALTLELASGQTRNLSGELRGNFSSISAVEHALGLQQAYELNRKSMRPLVDTAQLSLESIRHVIDDIGPNLLAGVSSGDPIQVEAVVNRGRDMLTDVVSFANTSHSGRYIFSGTNFDTPPLANAEQIIAELTAAVSGTSTASDFSAAVDAFFAEPAGGFYSSIYQGGDPSPGATQISKSFSVKLDVSAQDMAIRNAIRDTAVISLVEKGVFSGTQVERDSLLRTTATGLIDSNQYLIASQASLGRTQEWIENADVQSSIEKQMFEKVKSDIISIDPYEVATKLESVQTQLETLYLITSRTSRLNLSEYLR